MADIAERLLRSRRIDPLSGCWEWTGARKPDGYGRLFRRGRQLTAHRLAYEQWRGPIPPGLSVLHRCDNPACFNPEHLFLGTQADNIADCIAKGRAFRAKGSANGKHTHPGTSQGERNGRARLTEAEVVAIRSDRRGRAEIAAHYGVVPVTVWKVKTRRSWAHVEG